MSTTDARERMLLSSSLLALAGAAEAEVEGRERVGLEHYSDSMDVSLEFDPTSNAEQNMDELGAGPAVLAETRQRIRHNTRRREGQQPR